MYRITALLLVFVQVALGQNVKSPEDYFGYGYGQRFHAHAQVAEYTKYVAQTNPTNAKLLPYGRTSEGRELLVIAFGSAENIKNLEEIRKANLQNIGLLEGQKKEIPAIAMLSYNIHGNEAVNSEVALQMIYTLGKGNSDVANKVFKNTVVLIDPCANPDGLDRYVQWYNRHIGKNPNANPDAIEHREPWPGGRFNHYHMDMNRDLAWQTQLETQHRMAFYNSWMPQFHGDYHEMGTSSSYFFAPSAKPFHEDFTPYQREFQNLIGNYHKREFDKNGWLYYTKSRFDLLYPSYGDTYPSYNGAIAMTYEQSGSGVAGLAYKRSEGDTITLEKRMHHSYATSVAALDAVSDHADKIKEAFHKYFNEPAKNGYGKYKSYVLKGNANSIRNLTQLLDKLSIQYSFANGKANHNGFSYKSQKNENFSVEKEDLIVNTYQPKGVLTKIMFEPHTMLEDSNTYDITAWSLPYVYGLEAYGVATKLEGSASRTYETPQPISTQNAYAYALKLASFEDYQFLTAALQAGIKTRVQPDAFTVNGVEFPAGSVVFTRDGNPQLEQKLNSIFANKKASLVPMTSGMVDKGMDLGLDDVKHVSSPRIGILMGQGVGATNFGEVWHFIDQQLDYPATLLDKASFGSLNLSNYDVLIFPGGRYERTISSSPELSSWINRGGRLILLESAIGSFAGVDGFSVKLKKAPEAKADLSKKYGDAERASIANQIPGAIYEVNLDNTHPLAYGYGTKMNMLVKTPNNYELLVDGWNVGTLGELKSGFVGNNVKSKMKDAPIFMVQDKGRGKVIYLTESPIFRGFWYTGKALFSNALFFVK